MTPALLITVLESYRYSVTTEDVLQRGVERVLVERGIAHEREVRLSALDRVDFLVGDIGIECKIGSSVAEVIRQLTRYASSERIESLVLVTRRLAHAPVPQSLGGKPVHLVHVGGFL